MYFNYMQLVNIFAILATRELIFNLTQRSTNFIHSFAVNCVCSFRCMMKHCFTHMYGF